MSGVAIDFERIIGMPKCEKYLIKFAVLPTIYSESNQEPNITLNNNKYYK